MKESLAGKQVREVYAVFKYTDSRGDSGQLKLLLERETWMTKVGDRSVQKAGYVGSAMMLDRGEGIDVTLTQFKGVHLGAKNSISGVATGQAMLPTRVHGKLRETLRTISFSWTITPSTTAAS